MKKNIWVVGLLLAAVVMVLAVKQKQHPEGSASDCTDGLCTLPIPFGPGPKPVSAVPKPLPRLLDLGAGKCVPCKMMMPILEEMRSTFEGQLDVVFIDVWEDEAAGEPYGIRMIPTQIFFDAQGNELFRHEGFISREDLIAKWAELGFVFQEKE